MPDELDKQPTPPGGPVNQPNSGTQGDIAAVSRLRGALPPMPAPGGPPEGPEGPGVQSVPPRGTGPVGKAPDSPVPGVPAALLTPTDRPHIPVESAPQGLPGSNVPQMVPNQQYRQVLEAMSQSPDPEAREWAELVLEMLDL